VGRTVKRGRVSNCSTSSSRPSRTHNHIFPWAPQPIQTTECDESDGCSRRAARSRPLEICVRGARTRVFIAAVAGFPSAAAVTGRRTHLFLSRRPASSRRSRGRRHPPAAARPPAAPGPLLPSGRAASASRRRRASWSHRGTPRGAPRSPGGATTAPGRCPRTWYGDSPRSFFSLPSIILLESAQGRGGLLRLFVTPNLLLLLLVVVDSPPPNPGS
jgi:hypothetical protein